MAELRELKLWMGDAEKAKYSIALMMADIKSQCIAKDIKAKLTEEELNNLSPRNFEAMLQKKVMGQDAKQLLSGQVRDIRFAKAPKDVEGEDKEKIEGENIEQFGARFRGVMLQAEGLGVTTQKGEERSRKYLDCIPFGKDGAGVVIADHIRSQVKSYIGDPVAVIDYITEFYGRRTIDTFTNMEEEYYVHYVDIVRSTTFFIMMCCSTEAQIIINVIISVRAG